MAALLRLLTLPLKPTTVENAKKWVDIAGVLECPSVRLHIQRAGNSTPDAGRTAESLLPVAAYGAAKGVVINLENDDPFTEDTLSNRFFRTRHLI